MPKSILIVDDSAIVRKAMRTVFQTDTRLDVCGEAVDGIDALRQADLLQPDLITWTSRCRE